ncbi:MULTISPECIES: YIP1 family protein [unclassified Sporosarcina]|uniref:YIP1 family protein n=1 Tax=unclassified Sporosarcina TaxID=2647733 RepID=UPI0020421EBF|nr:MULTISPECIES: YIP1 family protein [unclassified Sporosarcina]GKV64976.1 YIP1 family protein [Sporosarcina sp. NCCP-2331]GLB56611.1 YIP1 family protein [Sporosarcina sp. NCCP-2378]
MNSLLTIWTQPKRTIEYVLEHKTWSYSVFILALTSLSLGLTVFENSGFLLGLPLIAIVMIGVFFSFTGGVIGWFINAGLYTWVGKWLGGSGNFKDMATVTLLGSIPMIWMFPFNFLMLAIYGKDLFIDSSTMPFSGPVPFGVTLFSNLLMIGLGVFSTVIVSKSIGVVHQFSAWRGFGTIMIIVGILLALMIPFFILLFMFLFMVGI